MRNKEDRNLKLREKILKTLDRIAEVRDFAAIWLLGAVILILMAFADCTEHLYWKRCKWKMEAREGIKSELKSFLRREESSYDG